MEQCKGWWWPLWDCKTPSRNERWIEVHRWHSTGKCWYRQQLEKFGRSLAGVRVLRAEQWVHNKLSLSHQGATETLTYKSQCASIPSTSAPLYQFHSFRVGLTADDCQCSSSSPLGTVWRFSSPKASSDDQDHTCIVSWEMKASKGAATEL